MADFTTIMTDTAAVGDSVIAKIYDQTFIVAYEQQNVMDALVERRDEINAKAISFPRYNQLTPATTPLTEKEDPASEAMVDSEVLLTPAEYGNVVTTTKLADLQTGGKSARGAVVLVANNMARSQNILGIRALEAGANVRFAQGVAADANITASHIMDASELDFVFNKLARADVPKHTATGTYIALMHDDVIHDLRATSATGSWTDVNKYNNEVPVLNNEVGMYKGFRIITNNDCLLNADAGDAGTVDVYSSSFIGFNALGKAQSAQPRMTITGPYDKLGRFMNIGWYGVFEYKIVEPTASWQIHSASSVGTNV